MKDSEFIELLNLYLDHEISGADAARLEAEVQSNPARRRIYQDYCRMQKACKVLAQDFAEEANGADDKVVAFNPAATRASRGSSFYTIGAFAAAAACVAIVFIGRSRQQAAAESQNTAVAVQVTAPAQSAPTAVGDMPVVPARSGTGLAVNSPRRENDAARATFVASEALYLTSHNATESVTTVAAPANDQFAWLHTNLDLVSIEQRRADQLSFQATPATLRPDTSQQLGGRGAMKNKVQEPASEMSAFELRLGR